MKRAEDADGAAPPVMVSLVVALALVAALGGLFWRGGDGPSSFTTWRCQTMQLDGQGLYRCATCFVTARNRGTDIVTLALAVPLLVAAATLYRRGSLRGALLLLGTLAYFLYVYATLALNTAYNDLFLVYVALFSASLFALAAVVASIDRAALIDHPATSRRGPATFMFACGAVTLGVWLGPLSAAQVADQPPKLLDSYATMVTYALDLAIITPLCFVAGALLPHRAALGHLIVFPLLGIIVLLAPAIVAQTLNQRAAGIAFAPPEIVGPIGGLGLLGVFVLWVMAALLRRVPRSRRSSVALASGAYRRSSPSSSPHRQMPPVRAFLVGYSGRCVPDTPNARQSLRREREEIDVSAGWRGRGCRCDRRGATGGDACHPTANGTGVGDGERGGAVAVDIATDLLRRADAAFYAAKRGGENRHIIAAR